MKYENTYTAFQLEKFKQLFVNMYLICLLRLVDKQIRGFKEKLNFGIFFYIELRIFIEERESKNHETFYYNQKIDISHIIIVNLQSAKIAQQIIIVDLQCTKKGQQITLCKTEMGIKKDIFNAN